MSRSGTVKKPGHAAGFPVDPPIPRQITGSAEGTEWNGLGSVKGVAVDLG